MKTIVLGHMDIEKAKKELAKHPGATLGYANKSFSIDFPVVKKVKKTTLVGILDKDDNNHITQKEVVEHFVKTKSVKEAVEILDEIDADDNGRITKKEVRTFAEKGDK